MPAEKVRIAAVADIHVSETSSALCRELFSAVHDHADILLLCGDLTNRGLPKEAEVLAEEIVSCRVPVLGVLGNHDVECDQQQEVNDILCHAGMHMLESNPIELQEVGFAGVKGFCGGFDRHMLAPWGEAIIKDFVREAMDEALDLESALGRLRTERKVAVLHYAPIRQTVEGEPPEIFAFLGSSRLAEPLDRFGVDVAVHGHAHRGAPEGKTLSGVPVYNVALPLMRAIGSEHPFRLLEL